MQRSHHGRTFSDPYEWLRELDSAEVQAHLEAENAWFTHCTADQQQLREELVADISARTQQTDLGVAQRMVHRDAAGTAHAYWYANRTVEGQQYPILLRQPTDDGPDALPPTIDPDTAEVVFDMNVAAQGHDFFSLGMAEVSPDGSKLAYSVDTSGDERFTVRIRDLATGEDAPDEITGMAWGGVWSGNDMLLLTRCDEAWRPWQVVRHRLGRPVAEAAVIFQEDDDRFWLGLDLSRDERWVVLSIASKDTTEVWMCPAGDPDVPLRMVAARQSGVEYDVEVGPDRLWITHNATLQGHPAPDFAVATADLPDLGAWAQRYRDPRTPIAPVASWTATVLPSAGTRVLSVEAYRHYQVVSVRAEAQLDAYVLSLTGAQTADDLPAAASIRAHTPGDVSTVVAHAVPDLDAPRVRISHTSLVDPPSIREIELDADFHPTGTAHLLRRTPVLEHPVHGAYRPEDYVQTRLWATARDGTQIPMSVVHRADVVLDGSAPALLYGYGSYEISMDPEFSISRLSLLDRGFVFAIAHIRGGGEMGRSWYEHGKKLHKRNTFTDFIDCAHHLVGQGYTSHDRLVAEGGSAGGLLMGAVANMAPEAFVGIAAEVPFVDPLTSMLQPDLPLTATEWDEWGDPLTDPQVYDYFAGYAPYENVTAQHYPQLLITTGIHDTRVSYVEPTKWLAALRHTALNDPQDFVFHIEMGAGHGGVTGRYDAWAERARELAWIITCATSRNESPRE